MPQARRDDVIRCDAASDALQKMDKEVNAV
jgi:hypothetical protein